jgi:hypothetical protein
MDEGCRDRPKGTIPGTGLGPKLISDRVASYEWETIPRREPKPPRERLLGLRPQPLRMTSPS